MKVRRAIGIALCFLIVLSGCNRSSKTFVGYDIPLGTNNLDPQFYEDKVAEMLIVNLYEGLVVKDSLGKIHPGVAESFAVSEDGLTYSFTLRENAFWASVKDQPSRNVTNKDFLFAFSRLFSPEAPSPHSGKYLAIENSGKILAGSLSFDELGIEIVGTNEIVFKLEYPDPLFLEKLSSPPAMPCNEDFFLSTKGRYGLEKELVLGNGPFSMERWDKENRITMKKNLSYKGETAVKLETVDIYIGRKDTQDRFKDSKTHIIRLESSELEEINQKKNIIKSYDGIVWCVAFNLESEYWSNPVLRQALVYSTDRLDIPTKEYSYGNTGEFAPTDSIFTKEILAGEAVLKDYKTDELPRPNYNLEKARESYSSALSILGLERIPSASIYIPEGGYHQEMMLPIQNKWQEALSLYITLNEVSQEELELVVRAEEYSIILLPLKPNSLSPQGTLEQFQSTSSQNYTNYKNSTYDQLLESIEGMKTNEQIATKARQGEQFLLLDSVVIPLYTQQVHYAVAGFADEIEIYQMEDIIRFHQPQTITD